MLRGNTAIVTGGSRGIGFAIAGALAEAGCRVLITGRRAEAVEAAANKIGHAVIPFVWDMEKLDEIDAKFKEASELLGRVDIFVNNAGLFAQQNEWDSDSLLATTLAEWQKVIDVNLSAVFFSMQTVVKYMRENHIKGNILNITSVAGYEPTNGAYGASKIAATGLTRGWGKRFAPEGIVINGIAPGPVATEMNGWHEGDPMEHDRIPFGRFATIGEIASLAMNLLSKESEMICGETVILDGAYAIK